MEWCDSRYIFKVENFMSAWSLQLYTDPVHGYKFHSKKEVLRYLQTGDATSCARRPTKRNVASTTKDDSVSHIFLDPPSLYTHHCCYLYLFYSPFSFKCSACIQNLVGHLCNVASPFSEMHQSQPFSRKTHSIL